MSNSPMHDIPGAFEKLQSLYFAGNDLMNQGKYSEAVELFTEGINIDDNFRYQYVTQYAMRAVCYFETQKYKESIQDYKKAIEIEANVNNRHADYYYTMGMCYNGLNEWENALVNLNIAIESNPQDYEAVLSRADSFVGLGKSKEALLDYELAIAHLGNLSQRIFDARDQLRKDLGLGPANPVLKDLSIQGSKLIDEKKFAEAIAVYTEAINLDDDFRYNHVTNYAMRGHCYMVTEQYAEAIRDFEKAIEKESNFKNSHADYYARIAKCYSEGLEDFENGILSYSKAIELKPDNYVAMYYRAYSYYNADKPKEALADFECVIEHLENIGEDAYEMRDELRADLGLEPITNADDPEVFPGEPISKLSDYVNFTKKLQSGDMNGALADYGIDMMQYGAIAQKWAQKMATDQELTEKYMEQLTN